MAADQVREVRRMFTLRQDTDAEQPVGIIIEIYAIPECAFFQGFGVADIGLLFHPAKKSVPAPRGG